MVIDRGAAEAPRMDAGADSRTAKVAVDRAALVVFGADLADFGADPEDSAADREVPVGHRRNR